MELLTSPKDQGPECSKDPFSTFPLPGFSEPERKALCVVWMTVCFQEAPTGSQEPIHSLTAVSRDLGHRELDLLRKEVRHSDILAKGGEGRKLSKTQRVYSQNSWAEKSLPEMFARCHQWTKGSQCWYFRLLLCLGCLWQLDCLA